MISSISRPTPPRPRLPVQVAKMPGLRRAPYFADYVTAFVNRLPGLSGHLDGLKVYSTLDPEYQADAQEAVESNLARLEKSRRSLRRKDKKDQLESAMVALDTNSGAIVAMVGGRDYASSQFNRVTQAQRQPGSAFKPIVYLAAMDPSRSPLHPPLTLASVLPDEPMSFNGWSPANYERTYQPQVTVVQALSESLNVPTAYVGSELGAPLMVKTAHEMGIQTDLPAVLPMAIGADEVTLLELTSAYQTFASMGEQATPYAVESVIDASGRPDLSAHTANASGNRSQRRIPDDRRSEGGTALWNGRVVLAPRYRFSGGGQNRHDAGLQGRILHRLHARCGLRSVGRIRPTRADWNDGCPIGAAGVGGFHGVDGAGRCAGFCDTVGHRDGDHRSRFGWTGDAGLSSYRQAAVSDWVGADATMSAAWWPARLDAASELLPEVSVPAAMPSPEPNAPPSPTKSDIFGKIGSFFGSLLSY